LDVAFAGAYDSLLHPERLAMYRGAGLLSGSDGASRAFDRGRDGFAASEGAAFLVLEEAGRARRRGAAIYGEIAGYGAAFRAYDRYALGPSAHGFAAAAHRALADARCDTVDAIFAHGLATVVVDREETAGLKTAFGCRERCPPLTATKSMLGNTCAAAGAIDAALAFLSLRDQRLPPTANLTDADPDCDLDYNASSHARAMTLSTLALTNASLGGSHATLVVRRTA
jgi:3-oxoacyl-(acyl-carrier-protein) synthase